MTFINLTPIKTKDISVICVFNLPSNYQLYKPLVQCSPFLDNNNLVHMLYNQTNPATILRIFTCKHIFYEHHINKHIQHYYPELLQKNKKDFLISYYTNKITFSISDLFSEQIKLFLFSLYQREEGIFVPFEKILQT